MSNSKFGSSDRVCRFLAHRGSDGALYIDSMDGKGTAFRIDGQSIYLVDSRFLDTVGGAFTGCSFAEGFGAKPPSGVKGSGFANTDLVLNQIVSRVIPPNGATSHDVLAVLKYYLCVHLLRSEFSDRPILLPFGPPGCGKTVFARAIGLLLLGSGFEVSVTQRKPRDLYSLLVSGPFVALDNVENMVSEVCDILCAVSTGASVSQRQLYTNFDVVRVSPPARKGTTSDEIADQVKLRNQGLSVGMAAGLSPT